MLVERLLLWPQSQKAHGISWIASGGVLRYAPASPRHKERSSAGVVWRSRHGDRITPSAAETLC